MAFAFSLVVLGALGVAALFGLLARGDIPVDVSAPIAEALNARVGGGYRFAVGSTALAETPHGPALAINAMSVADGAGRTIVAAPRAILTVDPLDLLFGRVSPKRLDFEGLVLRLVRLEDGSVGMSAGADQDGDLRLMSLVPALSGDPQGPGTAPIPADGTPGADAPAGSGGVPGSGAPRATAPTTGASRLDLPATVARLVRSATDGLFAAGSPIQAVDRLGISNSTLIVTDRLRGTSVTYRNVDIAFDRPASGLALVTVGADGPAGHLTLRAQAGREADGSRLMDLKAAGFGYDEMILAGGIRHIAFETDMPLSFDLRALVGADGRLRQFGGPMEFGAGFLRTDDPDHEPAMVDRMSGVLAMDPVNGTLTLDQGAIAADATRYAFTLAAVPPSATSDAWAVTGKATGVFGAERPGEQPIALDRIALAARVMPAQRLLAIDNFAVNGPEVAFRLDAQVQGNDTGFLLRTTMDMGRMPGQAVIRLWPNWVAAPVRGWLLRNLHGGIFEHGHGQFALTNTDLDRMREQHAVESGKVHVDFAVTAGLLNVMDGLPPLRGLDGAGVLTGNSFTFSASKADMEVSAGHILKASDGTFTVPDTDPKPAPATVSLRVFGDIDSLAELLSRDALRAYADVPIDAATVSGTFDGRLTVGFKLGSHDPKADTTIGVDATARNLTVAKVIGKEALQDATLNVTADRKGLHAKGDGQMFGAPAAVELSKPAGSAPSEASILLTLDDAARQKAGLSLGKSVTGVMTAKISTALGGESKKANVLLDFGRTAFDSPLPGLKKAAGKPSKATLVVSQEPGRTSLENIVFDSGTSQIRGSAVLDANNALSAATLTQLRLSPGDDARLDMTKSSDGYKVVVRGSNIDARPFLRYVTGADGGSGDGGGIKDLDLELHSALLTGQNAQALGNADLRMVKRGSQLRRLQMSGRLGRGAVTATTTAPGQIAVNAKDAGALLSFLDLYNRMDGGQLDAALRFAGDRMDGTTTVHNFTIREDPSIKKLAQEEVPSNSRNAGARIDPSAVSFTKLEAMFTRTGDKVEVRQGAMYGPQLGATVDGTLDFGHDRVALSGTFVPLYGLNNLVSHIPVLGLLLGGGAHEGLFALNYRITGPASAPVLSFNPLSALAPGFLRKIFGAIDDAAQQGLANGAHDEGQAPTPFAPD